jgi:hypothetical protein
MKLTLPLLLLAVVQLTACRLSYYSSSTRSCHSETRSVPSSSVPASEGDLEIRFSAAKAIDGFQKRDEAFSEIAADAARIGNSDLSKRAVEQIVSYPVRDDAALAACRAFVQRGMRDEATEMARMITSFPRRDEALQEVAK